MDERISFLCAAGLALALAACGGAVDNSDGRHTGDLSGCEKCADEDPDPAPSPSNDPDPDPGPTPAPIPTPAPAGEGVAMRYANLPAPGSTGGGSSGSTGGTGVPTIDPETMYVTFGNAAPICEDPFAAMSCGHWMVGFGIPAELLAPGIIDLGDPRLITLFSMSGPDRGGGDCYGGGGSYSTGTLEIVSIDADKIELRLANTQTFDFDANGPHTVTRCD